MTAHLIHNFPIRSRIAIAIGICQKASCILLDDAAVEPTVARAVDLAWRWEEGSIVRAADLYTSALEIGLLSQKSTAPKTDAFIALGTAMYYECSYAYAIDVNAGYCATTDVPSDLYEVDEDSLEIILNASKRTGLVNDPWIDEIISAVISKFGIGGGPDSLGSSIQRSFFGQSGIL